MKSIKQFKQQLSISKTANVDYLNTKKMQQVKGGDPPPIEEKIKSPTNN